MNPAEGKEKVMLLLVGGRSATPTIMGALQFLQEVDRVKFLLCEHKDNYYHTFQQNIYRLLKAAKPTLVCDKENDVKAVDGNNFDLVTTAVAELCDQDNSLLYVNLTSVPQPMAFAVYNYIRQKHPQALPFSVYTHTSQLVPLTYGHQPQNLAQNLTVEQYVTACDTAVFQYKFDVAHLSCTPQQAETLVQFFVANIVQVDQLLGILRQAGETIKTPKTIPVKKPQLPQSIQPADFGRFLIQLQENNLITNVVENETQFSYRVETQPDHAFLYGDWLEYYVYLQAKKAGFDSVKQGVELQNFNGEIDVCAIHQANALICECKTGRFNSADLARLESKAVKLGGNYCVRLFITSATKEDDDSDFQNFCNQAANKRIVVVSGNDLPAIGKVLKKEMVDPTYPRS